MEDAYFRSIVDDYRLAHEDERRLLVDGFIVVPGMVAADAMAGLREAYDAAMASGAGADGYKVGSSTTRFNDLVNRSAAFGGLYLFGPLLAASCAVIGAPFRLSSMLGRTLRAHTAAQKLHADLTRESDAYPMVGFILMVDAFRRENGATRFVPGSHRRLEAPESCKGDLRAAREDEVVVCGEAGSVVIFDASVWHGHAANVSDEARRSIQGYFVPRGAGRVCFNPCD